MYFVFKSLTDQCAGGFGDVLPLGGELLCSSIVAAQSMNSTLDKNESELGVDILTVLLQVLSDGNSLLDQCEQVLGDLRGTTSNSKIDCIPFFLRIL